MKFRPCIDLKEGKVVQIVGGSLRDDEADRVEINFSSESSPAEFARRYRDDNLAGGHVVALGPGNQAAALSALEAWPGGMQYGGGVNPENAGQFLDAGASHVIVTTYIFRDGKIDRQRLDQLLEVTGAERLVLDLSCRRKGGEYWIVTDRWQTFTDEKVNANLLEKLAGYCAEFLVHGVDVEGKMQGIEQDLIQLLGAACPLPVTYAGGVRSIQDMELIAALGQGRVDLTIGSALDIFGGDLPYQSVLDWQQQQGT